MTIVSALYLVKSQRDLPLELLFMVYFAIWAS